MAWMDEGDETPSKDATMQNFPSKFLRGDDPAVCNCDRPRYTIVPKDSNRPMDIKSSHGYNANPLLGSKQHPTNAPTHGPTPQ